MAFAEAVGKGALPELRALGLRDNQIGDEGAVALAEAVGKGARCRSSGCSTSATTRLATRARWPSRRRLGRARCPELKKLGLDNNKLSQTAEDAWEAVKAKRSGLDVVRVC